MLWVKAFHIIFVITWFAGLFYLPRLFVYHAMTPADDSLGHERFKIMERKLYGMTNLGGALAVAFGLWLTIVYVPGYLQQGWFHAKLTLVLLLIGYHVYCGYLVRVFRDDRNARDHVWFRWFNEAPVLILIAVVLLVVVKPF